MAESSSSTEEAFDRRADILRIATDLFLEKGYAGTSMSMLAKAVGVRKASLYHHFPSKEALFVACVTDGYDDAIATLAAIRDDPSLSEKERLRRAIGQLYEINVNSTAGRMSPLIAEVSLRFPEIARAFDDGFIAMQHVILNDILDAAEAKGAFAKLDRLGMDHLIFGPVVNVCLSRQMFAPFADLDERMPVERIRDSHADLIARLLEAGG